MILVLTKLAQKHSHRNRAHSMLKSYQVNMINFHSIHTENLNIQGLASLYETDERTNPNPNNFTACVAKDDT